MLLNRLGNKRTMAETIISHFVKHKVYVELFFGSGAVFFTKPRAEYNILNDINSNVFNLFIMVKDRYEELLKAIRITPYSSEVLRYFIKGKIDHDIWKAVQFLYISNFIFMGKGTTLKAAPNNYKDILIENLRLTMEDIAKGNNIWLNYDYAKVFDVASLHNHNANDIFVYADPPYIDTANNYGDDYKRIKWNVVDLEKLILFLIEKKCKFAISEFENDDVDMLRSKYDLNKNIIQERGNLKTRSTEILLTNYKLHTLF